MAESYISDILPKKFVTQHQLLLYYNDLIVDIIKLGDKYELSKTSINESEGKNIPTDCNDVIGWMIKNGHKAKALKILKSHTFFSILKDFIFYMHESFSCSERGKVSVAFTISRKPIKDSLFYLCWLYINEYEFLDYIMNKEIDKYDVTTIDIDKKKLILNEASKNSIIFSEENLLYDLIYKRSSDFGLSSIWDQSIHLVTQNKHYRTERGNLNFVFSDNELWDEYWECYYEKILGIMNFAMEIIISIFENIIEVDTHFISFNKYMRVIKQSIALGIEPDSNLIKFVTILLEQIEITCDECGKKYKTNKSIIDEFIYDYLHTCTHCGNTDHVGVYLGL